MKKRFINKLRKSKTYWARSTVGAMQPTKTKLVVFIGILAIVVTQSHSLQPQVDPTAYNTLLNTIAKGESKGNYNAYFGKVGNTKIRFTEMSVKDVIMWQEQYVRKGSASSAVGKYQIIRPTLAGLVAQLRIDPSTLFDENLQDRMAIVLLERRGAHAFVQKKLSREEFAASLAKEWAALPKATGVNPTQSHYAGDGINKSNISLSEIYDALASLEAFHQVHTSE